MAERAQVRSIAAVAAFRDSLVVYLAKIRAVLDEAAEAKVRTVAWLHNEQRPYWEREFRLRSQVLQEAEQELFSARLSQFRTASAAQALAVERARRALRQAEEKREMVRRWSREFENRADPMVKQVEQLQTFVTTDLAKAVSHLGAIVRALEIYAAPGGPAPAAPIAEGPAPTDGTREADRAADTLADNPEQPRSL